MTTTTTTTAPARRRLILRSSRSVTRWSHWVQEDDGSWTEMVTRTGGVMPVNPDVWRPFQDTDRGTVTFSGTPCDGSGEHTVRGTSPNPWEPDSCWDESTPCPGCPECDDVYRYRSRRRP